MKAFIPNTSIMLVTRVERVPDFKTKYAQSYSSTRVITSTQLV